MRLIPTRETETEKDTETEERDTNRKDIQTNTQEKVEKRDRQTDGKRGIERCTYGREIEGQKNRQTGRKERNFIDVNKIFLVTKKV